MLLLFSFSFFVPTGRKPQLIMVHHTRLSVLSSSLCPRDVRRHQLPTGLEAASTSLTASGKAAGHWGWFGDLGHITIGCAAWKCLC